MELRSLATFVQVAELGSFSRAAEKLGYSQPTVSVHIRLLEEELGVKLFDRIGHNVGLTDQGREVLAYAQRICHMCQEMEQTAGRANAVGGVIRLAMAQSLCGPMMLRVFARLRENYPDIRLELTTAGTGELFRLLDHNEVDMVCTLDSHIYNPNYIIACEEKIGVHLIAPPHHPLTREKTITGELLVKQELLLTEKSMSYRRLLDDYLAKQSLASQPVLENGDADLLCRLVEQGLGVSFLPDYVTEEAIARGNLVRLKIQDFEPELWKQLLYRRDKWISPPMQVVLDYLKAVQLAPQGE